MLNQWAGWIAPVATAVAAMMTAVNLGARVTGWGFVVFTLGSICWTTVGLATGQTNLVVANGFLTLVNLIGIWRWLLRQSTYEAGGQSAKAASRRQATPTLFTASGLAGMPVAMADGGRQGHAVEALIECGSATISYVVVSTPRPGAGVLGEELRAVPREAVTFHGDHLVLALSQRDFAALAPLCPDAWPGACPSG
jgi:hypothetical protein